MTIGLLISAALASGSYLPTRHTAALVLVAVSAPLPDMSSLQLIDVGVAAGRA